jgi:hypothetical protein
MLSVKKEEVGIHLIYVFIWFPIFNHSSVLHSSLRVTSARLQHWISTLRLLIYARSTTVLRKSSTVKMKSSINMQLKYVSSIFMSFQSLLVH